MMVIGKRKGSGFDLERDGEEKQQFRSLWFVLVMFRVKETARWGHYSNWYGTTCMHSSYSLKKCVNIYLVLSIHSQADLPAANRCDISLSGFPPKR